MKRLELWLRAVGLLLWAVTASAEGQGDAGSAAAERIRIAAERVDVERHYQGQVRVCQERFVVTACLNEAKAQRRVRMDDLQQQSRLLDADQRKRDGSVAIQRVEKKLTEEQDRPALPRPAASARAAAPAASETARPRAEKTPSAKSEQQERAGQLADEDRQRRRQEAANRRAASAQAAASKTRAYEARQEQAQRRRIAHDQKLKERTKPRADSLPPG